MTAPPVAVDVFALVGILTCLCTALIVIAAGAHWVRWQVEERRRRTYVPREWVEQERHRGCDEHPSRRGGGRDV